MPTSFQSLGLRAELLSALEQISYVEMTPIQAHALPPMLRGRDVTGQAKTGSGKTAAFGLALLQAIDTTLAATQALVLCPTRELAEQVATELRRLAQKQANTRVVTICGGRPYRNQRQALQQGSHVVVGTPGRIGKHLRKETMDLGALRVLVLDEADRMLDMGFIEQVDEIVACCPKKRQTLLFSATFPEEISSLSARIQHEAKVVQVETQVAPDKLRQLVYSCSHSEREQLVVNLLGDIEPATALIFCETRDDCRRLGELLESRGAVALSLHGELEQRERDDVLLQFSNGSASVLVATNLAARGLDIPSLPLVIIAELSPDPESHLHRIGRTGRAGEEGLAVSIVAGKRETARLAQIEAQLGHPIEEGPPLKTVRRLDHLKPANRTLLILSGRRDKLRKGDVLGALVKDGGIPPEAIGRIDLMPTACAVAVAIPYAKKAADHLKHGRIKNKRVRVQLLG
jgi:ATP-independent RNA helicase DbpA